MSASRVDGRAVAKREVRKSPPQARKVHVGAAPRSQSLLHADDSGEPVVVDPTPYIAAIREPGWGPYLEAFLSRNQAAIQALGLESRIVPGRDGVRLELHPGMRAGAIPLRSAVTGLVTGGVIVKPRFGWPGVGQVLAKTGWGSGPEFLDLPLVPGSGREVPPWVLAGPVLHRLAGLLANLRPGYRERVEVRSHPRGQIQWQSYLTTQLPTGRWHQLPCRFSELDTDTKLRQAVRWTLERLRTDLSGAAGSDPVALLLTSQIVRLLEQVLDVPARRPDRRDLVDSAGASPTESVMLREGLRAMGWVVDERGLGGGRTSDGLAWALPLEQLWERYVESVVRAEAALTGGHVRAGRSGETTVPLAWGDSRHRALGHLVPDFVVHRSDSIEIVDAKYKSHFAKLDASSWHALTDQVQDSMRADIHQVLAYAAACGSAETIRATLVYPVKRDLFDELQARRRAVSEAVIPVGSRQIKLRMQALAFGSA